MNHLLFTLFSLVAAAVLRAPFASSFDSGSPFVAFFLTICLMAALLVVVPFLGIPRQRPIAFAWGIALALAVSFAGTMEAYGRRAGDVGIDSFTDYLRVRAEEGWDDGWISRARGPRRGSDMWFGFFVNWALPLAGCWIVMRVVADEGAEPNDPRDRAAPRDSGRRACRRVWTTEELCGAVNQREVASIRVALDRGVPPDATDPSGKPLAFVAARLAPRGALEAFLRAGLDPTLRDRLGATLLHAVVRRETLLPLVKPLLQGGLDADVRNDRGETPLMCAAHSACAAGMERMLNAGANPLAVDGSGANTLHHLLRSGPSSRNREETTRVRTRWIPRLIRLGVDPDALDAQGEDALRIAASCGWTEELGALLKHRERPLVPERASDAMVRALLAGHDGASRVLREAGAPISFWAALLLGDATAAEAALDADPSLVEATEHPCVRAGPLAFALRGGNLALATWLLERGADPAAPTFHAFLVDDASRAGADYAFFELAVNRGGVRVADSRNADGFSALHLAAEAGRRDLVELLLRHGADENARTERGQSVIDSAANQEIRELLMRRGAR